MKAMFILIISLFLLASCGGSDQNTKKTKSIEETNAMDDRIDRKFDGMDKTTDKMDAEESGKKDEEEPVKEKAEKDKKMDKMSEMDEE